MKRSRSVLILAVILTLLGLSSLRTLVTTRWDQPLPVAAALLRVEPRTTAHLLLTSATVYCGATLLCAFSLFRMSAWAPMAYWAFTFSAVVYFLLFLYLIRFPGPIALSFVFFAGVAAGLYWGWRVVKRGFVPASNAL